VIAPVQPNDRQFGIGHFPNGRNAVRHALWLVDHNIDQSARALEIERLPFVLALEPRAVAKLDR
jgi:hypothetical protein